MADITMCQDGACPKRHTCYRFNANPDLYWQSYFYSSPREGDKCLRYWKMETKTGEEK